MAHGDSDVAKDDVTDVTVSPPVTITTTEDGEADTKQEPNPERGKSRHITYVLIT
jgi:hypothetical protein